MTTFQMNQDRAYACERKRRFDRLVAAFGPRYVDTIYANPDRHGDGKMGFTCAFSGHSTSGSHHTLAEFARHAFGTGILRRVERSPLVVNMNSGGSNPGPVYIVLKPAE
jgi:hypothetical protein